MKQIDCPLNGPLNISEFIYGGELVAMPDAQHSTAREWAEYVFFDDNHAGNVVEWWCHAPTSYWFLVERNTITDEIIKTYAATEVFATRVDFGESSS